MKVAVGWLGWSEEYALQANVNTIHLGFEGRLDMLKSIFGGGSKSSGDEATPPSQLQEITPDMNITTVPKDVHGKPITLTTSLFDSLSFVKRQNKKLKHKPNMPIPAMNKSPSQPKQRRVGKLLKKDNG